MRSLLLLIVSALCFGTALGQPLRVGFYNVENLYDTVNDPNVNDGDFTPSGRKKWTAAKYRAKLARLSSAVALFNPDLLGLCEVENRGVVQDLSGQTKRLRGVVHYDSHDSRGIDVALVFDTAKLKLLNSEPIFIKPMRRPFLRAEFVTTRAERLIVFVVHLPSKLGGKAAAKRRGEALCSLDSLVRLEHTEERVLIVGDFNDSPRVVGSLINCALPPFERGEGSYAYRDAWDMIDQILVSQSLRDMCGGQQKVVIHSTLLQSKGRFIGYPLKGVVSDHLPIYIDVNLRKNMR